jgi:hypothetical protein
MEKIKFSLGIPAGSIHFWWQTLDKVLHNNQDPYFQYLFPPLRCKNTKFEEVNFLDCLILKMKAVESFSKLITLYANACFLVRDQDSDSLRVERSWDQIPVGSRFFCSRPDRPWGPHSLLYNGYRVFFLGVKRPGRGPNHAPPSSAEVKARVELHLYCCSGPSWPVVGLILPLIYLLPLANIRKVLQ